MSRFTDVAVLPSGGEPPPLPVVDWQRIGRQGPQPLPTSFAGPTAPLPKSDVVVLTWTSAEWSAMDQVFVTSNSTRPRNAWDWQQRWNPYSRGAPASDTPGTSPLWGFFQLVQVTPPVGPAKQVLLFKCDAHLAHPPWFAGLAQMIGCILDEARPDIIFSIGTAGGARPETRLGDVVLTDAGHITLQDPNNAGAPVNNDTFTCSDSPPSTDGIAAAQQLMFPLTLAVTYPALQANLVQLQQQLPAAANLTLDDLLSPALDPKCIADSQALPMWSVPVLSTDYYFIAAGNDATEWSALEMDDAVIAYVAGQQDVPYAFVRNISDPVVPSQAADGSPIADDIRDHWSSITYEQFGLYTSFNGALATWALIAGA